MNDDLTQYGGSPITGENCAERAQLLLETGVGPEAFAFGASVLMPVMVKEITRLRARVAELELPPICGDCFVRMTEGLVANRYMCESCGGTVVAPPEETPP